MGILGRIKNHAARLGCCESSFNIETLHGVRSGIAQHFDSMEGVEVDIDNILVWGRNEEEHNRRLKAVLQKCKEINLTLNKDKCLFNKSEIVYIGHVISKEGVKPDKEKVEAIVNMPPPTDKKEVERLLGTVNYLAKFIPNMSIINEPIRNLLKSENMFIWDKP